MPTFSLLKETFKEWQDDKVTRLAAALAYYTMLSLAPLLIIVVSIAGFVFGEAAAAGEISAQISATVGESAADLIETAIAQAGQPGSGMFATIIGVITLILGATGVFAQLQDAMNTVWDVQPRPDQGVGGMVKKRITALAMVLGIGFLLLVSLTVSALLRGLNEYLSGVLPGGAIVWQVVNFVVSLAVITLLFAMIFKYLPDVHVSWGDVWVGALVTAILFTIGQFLLGFYFGSSAVGSAYGAAGSLVALLVWVYYSALIMFFGAEFTQVYARHQGARIVPDEGAVALTAQARARQGIPRQAQVVQAQDDQEHLAALLTNPATVEQGRRPRAVKASGGERAATVLGFLAGFVVGARRGSSEQTEQRRS